MPVLKGHPPTRPIFNIDTKWRYCCNKLDCFGKGSNVEDRHRLDRQSLQKLDVYSPLILNHEPNSTELIHEGGSKFIVVPLIYK